MVFLLAQLKSAIIINLVVVLICLGDNEIEGNKNDEITDDKNNEIELENENNSEMSNEFDGNGKDEIDDAIFNMDINEQELSPSCEDCEKSTEGFYGSRSSPKFMVHKKVQSPSVIQNEIVKLKLPKLMEYFKSLKASNETSMQIFPNDNENFTKTAVRLILSEKKYVLLEEAAKSSDAKVILMFELESKFSNVSTPLKCPNVSTPLKCPKSQKHKRKPYLTVPKPPKFKRTYKAKSKYFA